MRLEGRRRRGEGEEREGGGGKRGRGRKREQIVCTCTLCSNERERETAQPKLTSINITVGNLEKLKFGKLQISFIGWLIIGPVSLSMRTVNKTAGLILVNGKKISKFTN